MNEKDVKEYWKKLKKIPNVIGFDSAPQPKIRGGVEDPSTKAFRIYVSKKVPACALKEKHLVPCEVGGLPTDVVEIGEIKALTEKKKQEATDPKGRFRPIIAGTSGCHANCTACTITGFFRDNKTGQVLIGLNNHCGALENKAAIGDPWIQPSPYDGGLPTADRMAVLHHFVEIKFNDFTCPYRNFFHKAYRFLKQEIALNKVDISFGTPELEYEVAALGIPNSYKGTREPTEGEQVHKMGRTTGYTVGTVLSLNWTGQVGYSRGAVTFTDCIIVQGDKFSQGGDSGSPVFDMEGNLVGILFAGSDTHTILCKVGNVEAEGDVTLVTSGT